MATGKANNIKAKTFNIEESEQYHLYIQIGLTHFSYCIINHMSNVIYLNNYKVKNNIIEIINADDIIKASFATTSVSFVNLPSTLVPKEIYKDENNRQLLELNTDAFDIIKTDDIKGLDAYLIYSIPTTINNIVTSYFPNAKQTTYQKVLIEECNKLENKDSNAYLNILEKILTITAFKEKKLIFNNTFKFETKEDLLYFILFVFEQLDFDAEKVSVKLFGNIQEDDENYKILYEYIKNIKFGSSPNNIEFPSEFKTLNKHELFTLFAQHSCV